MIVRILNFETTSLLRIPAGCVSMPATSWRLWIRPTAAIGRLDRVKQLTRLIGKIPLSALRTIRKSLETRQVSDKSISIEGLGGSELYAGRSQTGPRNSGGRQARMKGIIQRIRTYDLRRLTLSFLLLCLCATCGTPSSPDPGSPTPVSPPVGSAPSPGAEGWIPLFNGKDLDGWEITNFGGEGTVHVLDGIIRLEMGNPLTGIHWVRDFPRDRYEISLEAMKVLGNDFFCGLTFPVGKGHASLILGGWGGGVTGLSCINGKDASENETTLYRSYQRGRWYHVRVRVDEQQVRAWVDEEKVVDVPREGRIFSVRAELRRSCPVGVANYLTVSCLRNIRRRSLVP